MYMKLLGHSHLRKYVNLPKRKKKCRNEKLFFGEIVYYLQFYYVFTEKNCLFMLSLPAWECGLKYPIAPTQGKSTIRHSQHEGID